MGSINNFNFNQNFTSSIFAPSNSSVDNIANNTFVKKSILLDITEKLSTGNYEEVKDEIDSLVNLLKNYSVNLANENNADEAGDQRPSILSTTESYIKVLKALQEVIDKLNEKEKEFRQKMEAEAEAQACSEKIEQLKVDMEKVLEKLQFLSVEENIDDHKEYKELENLLFTMRDKYNIDITPEINIKASKFKTIKLDTVI